MTLADRNIASFARDLALQAGQLMIEARQSASIQASYKGHDELVTNIDLAVDRLIRDALTQAYPDHRILSEESSPSLSLDDLNGPLWVIDPIDGTVNFAYGHYQTAVSIAYLEDGQARYGIVYAPFIDECYEAMAGGGARLNGQSISVSNCSELGRALVATGFPYQKDNASQLARRVEAVLKSCRDIRRLGSAAMDICWVANGRLDAYYESVSPWDLAAARLIAQEAGARCGHLYPLPAGVSADLFSQNVLISTPAIHEAMARLLKAADCSELT